ncbi:MAG TPA: hypothetical protein VMR23_05490 [Candidatus Limnocylindria bacterium]|nr:hypothetical protein [Candidatus Limnocylindria bacterium]
MRSIALALLVALGIGGWPAVGPAAPSVAYTRGAPDRLDRFRELATTRLGAEQLLDSDRPHEAHRELYALLDEEIVESLASGSVFASTGFIQDRLDAFGEAWGGARFALTPVGRMFVGAFELGPGGNSIRVYGGRGDEAALLAAMYREGRPAVHALPAAGGGQFVATWEGAPSGRGTRVLRVELVRPHGDGVQVVWSTADLFPQGLLARGYAVRGAELRVRYEVHYPGWTPGCGGQTEQEDVYRLAASGAGFVRVSRQEHDAWHRAFRGAVARVFAALAVGDQPALATLVPDKTLRARLPALVPEPVCDAQVGGGHDTVSVAAAAADQRPWTLTFRRVGALWRLTEASPLLH